MLSCIINWVISAAYEAVDLEEDLTALLKYLVMPARRVAEF